MAYVILGSPRQMESVLLPSPDQFGLAHDAIRERILLDIILYKNSNRRKKAGKNRMKKSKKRVDPRIGRIAANLEAGTPSCLIPDGASLLIL